MKRIPVGIQLHTVREDLKKDQRGTIEALGRMGYEGVEGSGTADTTPREFRRLVEDNGMKVVSSGVGLPDLENNLAATVDRCGELGINTLMIGYVKNILDQQHQGDWKALTPRLAAASAKAREAGLRILYHNHAYELEALVDGKPALDYLYANVPAADLKAQIDTYWIKTGGQDPVEYVRRYADRIPLLHIKDRAPAPADQECPFAEIGHGILDWDGIFTAAAAGAVEWYLVEQDRWARPALECARLSIEYLRSRGMTRA